jgi:predicted metalloendopeptidase
MGHEITHGFDNSGGEYDENGNKITWLSNATITAFNILIQCFVQQYDNYTLEQIDEPVFTTSLDFVTINISCLFRSSVTQH